MSFLRTMVVLIALVTGLVQAMAQVRPPRPAPPTRDPNTPGYVKARQLPDGAIPPPNVDGNFILGPAHNPAPEMTVQEGVPQGTVYNFTMESKDSKFYPGIAREPGTFGQPDPSDPAKLIVTTSHPAPYTRKVAVYVPKQYVPGMAAPFIVGADGPDKALFPALDNLISQKRVPVMIAISIGNGSGDAQGSQRGLEYDTMSGRYAEFVEQEVLPLVEKQYNVKLTKDPDGRATMGGSSGGSCALIMAWYHPELYHRVLTYSGTYVNQQWPYNPETPHGAWEFHEKLIPNSTVKPLRIWMEVGDRDNFNARDGFHDWVLANENMAKVLADKGYHYQFVFARNGGHTDRTVKQQTLPEALEYVWQGYKAPASFAIAGDWDVRVDGQTLHVTPPAMISVTAEKYATIPMFNPKAGGWVKGAQLRGVKSQETTSPHLLDEASFALRAGPEPYALLFTKGVDYEADLSWGTFGRLADGRIKPDQAVFATYRHTQMRLDAVVLTSGSQIVLRQGEPRAAAPAAPPVNAGERQLGNINLPGFVSKLEPEHLFPILEQAYPEPQNKKNATVTRLVDRLNSGQPFRILAWGDSVTDGAYLPDRQTQRWQEQFVARLRERFPKARIELITQAWGGRNTGSYLAEPPGSPHNYRETVLAAKPDLIVSEFVNDAGLKPPQVEERYSKLLADFKAIGAEWIILTPHYVRPDWMGLTRERDIDDDPRPYVAGLRAFAATHDVALADASLRYGRLWRQGVPYNTLLMNAINHPNAFGMRLFADALMALFP